jgi:hypothetical protein
MSIANQLQTRSTIFAIDALKNLCIQAFLMAKDDYAAEIIKLGYIDCVSTLIQKALNLLEN